LAAPDDAVRVEAVAAALTARTRLVAVSSAQYASGAVTDLAALGALCRERGVLLCVDGIQTLGALPIDVKAMGVHFLAADSHKWLLGMSGIGGLFVDAAVLERIRPVLVGWKSTIGAWDFDRARFALRPSARKLEEGSPAYGLIAGLDAAIGLLEEVGVPAIDRRVRALTARLAESLCRLGCDVGPAPGDRAHILTFLPPRGDPEGLARSFEEAKICVSFRRGRFRVSPHFYNTFDEVDVLVRHVQGPP
jgi:selenocysteine lyase/cysteine desulfurase